MHEIIENASLEMTNVLTFRGKVTQQQFIQINKEMNELIHSNNAQKVMKGVSATFSIDSSVEVPVMDIEIMYPLDKVISVTDPYIIKPVFRLRNAVKIRHTGDPSTIQNTANEVMQYIKEKDLMPITAGYNVTVQEPANPTDVSSLIIDIYIGVSDNIL